MPTYYAQAAGAIQSVVWDTVPTGGGSTLTWPPGAADVLVANGKALTWAAAEVPTLTCARLSTTGEDTGTAGGGFALSGSTAVAITADIVAGTTTCLTSTHTGTGANGVTLTAPAGSTAVLTGGSVNQKFGWTQNGVGSLTIVGHVIPGIAEYSYGLNISANALVTMTGNATGGTGAGSNHRCAICVQNSGRLNLWGTVTGGQATYSAGIYRLGPCTINVYGNIVASGGMAVRGSANTITVYGNILNGSSVQASDFMVRWVPSYLGTNYYTRMVASDGTYRYYTHPPAQTDVRDGIFAGFSDGVAYNGNVVLPSAGDVKTGVAYGAGGTEFEGTLAAGGGGVPLIGPGGLVG